MTSGIHHITAIASDGAQNLHFYSHILGLRLVKKTVNQDDVETYHLFFGDRVGHPGMDLTFFIFHPAQQGEQGNGLVTRISLAVPVSALPFWQERFEKYSVQQEELVEEFGTPRLRFLDDDGQHLELVGVPPELLSDSSDVWATPEISASNAIHSFYSTRLSVENRLWVEPILEHVFGYKHIATSNTTKQFQVENSDRAALIEVDEQPDKEYGFNAAGTVHHIAFRAKDAAEQQMMRQRVIDMGLQPTEEIDRFYFKSVYFRIPAGILFEIATDGPGFIADEPEATLGQKLALPPFLESQRAAIEAGLPPLS